jgi:hypothetical protein
MVVSSIWNLALCAAAYGAHANNATLAAIHTQRGFLLMIFFSVGNRRCLHTGGAYAMSSCGTGHSLSTPALQFYSGSIVWHGFQGRSLQGKYLTTLATEKCAAPERAQGAGSFGRVCCQGRGRSVVIVVSMRYEWVGHFPKPKVTGSSPVGHR